MKLAHLIGFIIRIYHYARSHERQMVRFIEVNKHFRSLDALNYAAAYIHYGMKV